MKKWCLLFLLLCSQIAFAIDKKVADLVLTGQEIEYNDVSGNILATGNAQILYKNYVIKANNIDFSVKDNIINCYKNFRVLQKGQDIKADSFSYNFNTYIGEAVNLDSKIEDLKIHGKKVIFSKDRLTINGALFTTCEAEAPHYLLRAETIYLYPQLGFLVAFNNNLDTNFLPISPWLPTYVYGNRSYMASSTPIPEIGSSPCEGVYIKQRYGYFLNEKSSGTLDFGYSQNLGILTGVNHGISFDDNKQKFNLRVHFYEKELIDHFDGAAQYQINLISPVKKMINEEDELAKNFFEKFAENEIPPANLTLLCQHREILFDSRISYLPKIQADFNEINLFNEDLFLNTSLGYGVIKENTFTNNFIEDNEKNLNVLIHKKFDLKDNWILDVNYTFLGNWYDNAVKWERYFNVFRFSNNKLFFQPSLFYTKIWENLGCSPFVFENYYALVDDEFGLQLNQDFGAIKFTVLADYQLNLKTLRNLDFVVGYKLHCWRLNIGWRTQQFGQFTFGVDIE